MTELRTSSSSPVGAGHLPQRGALGLGGLAVAEPGFRQLDGRPVRLQALLEDTDIDRVLGMARLDRAAAFVAQRTIIASTIATWHDPLMKSGPPFGLLPILMDRSDFGAKFAGPAGR